SKKSGSATVSHLRFGPEPIRSTYLVEGADFVACHQFGLLGKMQVLEHARPGATFLLNSPYPAEAVWDHLPLEVQQQILAKRIAVWVVDADRVAAGAGMGKRVNTVMQPCFFQLSGVLPADDAIAHIKASVEKTYGKRGRTVVEQNFAAIDFVTRITSLLMAGEGERLPVSALPVDGTFPTGTARYEKRAIASEIPIWDPSICIDCGKCTAVCPHAAIRMKVYEPTALAGAPDGFLSKEFRSKDLAGHRMTIQVAPDDCTGCGVCVDVCPAKSKT